MVVISSSRQSIMVNSGRHERQLLLFDTCGYERKNHCSIKFQSGNCMTVQEFRDLKNLEKIHLINRDGSFVAERRMGTDRIYLFIIGNFFVELLHRLSDPDCRGVIIYDIFDDESKLQFYLEKPISANIFSWIQIQ